MSYILETMDEIDELTMDLHYHNMFLNHLCNEMQEEMDGLTDILIELGE